MTGKVTLQCSVFGTLERIPQKTFHGPEHGHITKNVTKRCRTHLLPQSLLVVHS